MRDTNDMDDRTNSHEGEQKEYKEMVRRHLKVLLLHLAARSEKPSEELEDLLQDVIQELHKEVKEALEARTRLRLVVDPPTDTLN